MNSPSVPFSGPRFIPSMQTGHGHPRAALFQAAFVIFCVCDTSLVTQTQFVTYYWQFLLLCYRSGSTNAVRDNEPHLIPA